MRYIKAMMEKEGSWSFRDGVPKLELGNQRNPARASGPGPAPVCRTAAQRTRCLPKAFGNLML